MKNEEVETCKGDCEPNWLVLFQKRNAKGQCFFCGLPRGTQQVQYIQLLLPCSHISAALHGISMSIHAFCVTPFMLAMQERAWDRYVVYGTDDTSVTECLEEHVVLPDSKCFFCGLSEQVQHRFFRCAYCRYAAYCGKFCQEADWENHKSLCKGHKSK